MPGSQALCTDLRADCLPEFRFSTVDLPARLQFDALRNNISAWVEASPLQDPAHGFRTEQRSWQLGPLAISWTVGQEGVSSLRNQARTRRDQLDHWVISLLRRGEHRCRFGDETVTFNQHNLGLYGMHMPGLAERDEAEWVVVFIARDALPEIAPSFDALLGRTLDTALGGLLRSYLDGLTRQLPQMTRAEAPRAAEATLAVLRAAITGSAEHCAAARPQLQTVMRSRVTALIRQNIGSARLDPTRLCRMAGVSRSQLYRIFEPEGGVAHAIQRERLRAIRRALADPAERRSIGRIAEGCGMPDPSSFSRAFRQEFGMTPGEFRDVARSAGGSVLPDSLISGQPRPLDAMFRHLRS
ncbi:helix-turn-helix transcriptional regulator [Roseicella aquatilis]|uniref:helix-turn-helix transcriptional regulator n=1 Tax=Roseicella aquatilis TaxID=2527868 RepID=UPI0014048D05|nr:helix-turn-helix transcriptional regulator [Roseicella aquatilis]